MFQHGTDIFVCALLLEAGAELTPHHPANAGRPKGSGRGGGRAGVARSNSGGSDDATLLHSIEHGRGGDKTKRNPKQQLQNKQAQQRYRCGATSCPLSL